MTDRDERSEGAPAVTDASCSAAVVESMRREYWQSISEVPDQQLPVRTLAVLRLQLDGHPYILPLSCCRHVLRVPRIVRVPRPPPWVIGTIAYRGEIFPLLDLRGLLGLPPREPDRKSRVVLLCDEGVNGALLADRVEEVTEMVVPSGSPEPGTLAHPLGDEQQTHVLSGREILEKVLSGIDRSGP